jgi:hypothetical protein
VWFHAGQTGARLELLRSDGTPVAEAAASPDGLAAFETAGLAQGAYDVRLLDGAGAELARDRVVLVAADQPPVLELADRTLRGDQVLEVTWRFGPGNRYDWLAVYRAGVSAKDGLFKRWRYVDGAVEGTTTIGPRTRGPGAWPLPSGRYEVRLCLDDSYRCRTSVPFTVQR